ncbi:MAG: hypothetical protein IJ751_07115 [Oscillospiraceae bacterium]|nr:hypothetical protein [Oscillospiraceae bacterium]
MTALIVIGIILLLIVLILLLRVGVRAIYDADGFVLDLKIGPLHFRIIPMQKKQRSEKQEEKKRRKAQEKKRKKAEKEKKKQQDAAKKKEQEADKPPQRRSLGDLLWLLQLVGPALHALAQLRRKLCIRRLAVQYAIAGRDDPAAAAIRYGQVSAGGGALFPLINAAFDVRNWELDLGVDFMEDKTRVALEAEASYRIGQLLGVALQLGFKALRIYLKHRKETKQKQKEQTKPENQGKKPNQTN